MGAEPQNLRLIMADSDVVPDDGGTAGSRTTPSTVPAVRAACAAARQFLLESAAKKFRLPLESLTVRNGSVIGLKDQVFGYKDLATLPNELPEKPNIKKVENWEVLGESLPRVDSRSVVTGRHQYPSDITRPGMLHGAVLRAPSYGAKLESIDLTSLKARKDLVVVHDGGFVGVAAETRAAANRAIETLKSQTIWKSEDSQASSDTLPEYLRGNVSEGRRPSTRRKGEPEAALKSAVKQLSQSYHVAYIQHAPMEPRAAVAEWNGGKLTVWTGTQQPARVRGQLAESMRVKEDHVRLIVPDTGGGFGGKHSGEAAVEAARLAKAAKVPVSVRWSREEEFTWAYFRPAGVIDVAGGLDAQGKLAAWQQTNFNSGGSAIETPYNTPNVLTEFKSCDQPLRSGSYRALASTANVFARECLMDELAAELNLDPLDFRLRNLENERLRAVLEAVTRKFNWAVRWKLNKTPQKVGVGLGCGTEKGSYMAVCAEVEADHDDGTFKVTEICSAFECGAIHNPDNLRAQVEGCVLQGLGAVLREEIQFNEGRILNPKFSQYHVPRFSDVPKLETVVVNRPDLPSVGGSETPIIGIAPAVANALHHAVQVRIRSLPLRDDRYRARA